MDQLLKTDINENKIPKLFSYRVLTLLGALIAPILAIEFLLKNADIDPFLLYMIMAVLFVAASCLFKKATQSFNIPYLLLQLIFIWILLDFTYLDHFGINIKFYTLIFGFALLMSVFYGLKYHNYLWQNFPVFRYLLIFFILNIFYFLFYHSDFRSSPYPDIWFQRMNQELFKNASFTLKNFSENSSYVIYLISLSPLVSIVVSLMTFYGCKIQKSVDDQLINIIKWVTYGFIVYFLAAILAILVGFSSFAFEDGRLTGNFFGASFGFHIYLSMFLIFLVGFKFYLKDIYDFQGKNLLSMTLNSVIFLCFALILLQINKTSIIGLAIVAVVTSIINLKMPKDKTNPLITGKRNTFSKLFLGLIPLLIVIAILLQNSDFLGEVFNSIADRFSSMNTLDSRTMTWKFFITDWFSNLSIFRLFFGHGIDASVENIFFISSMFPRSDLLLSTHNIYIGMFYDYGLVALLYFGAMVSVIISNIKLIFSKNSSWQIRLFSKTSLGILIFFMVYHFTDGLRIPIAIMFFCLIGVLESLKYSYLHVTDNAALN